MGWLRRSLEVQSCKERRDAGMTFNDKAMRGSQVGKVF